MEYPINEVPFCNDEERCNYEDREESDDMSTSNDVVIVVIGSPGNDADF